MQPGRCSRGAHGPYGKRCGGGRNGPFRPAVLYTDASRKYASLQKQSGDVNKTVFRAEKKRLGGGALACVRAPRAPDGKPDGGQESCPGASRI